MKFLKAIVAFVLGSVGALSTGLMPDPGGATVLTWPEVLGALAAGIVAAGGVAVATNAGVIRIDKLPAPAELAREAFEAYAQAVNNRTVAGNLLPPWESVDKPIKDAWTRAQGAVLALIRR
jgi:hypothetical protein